MSLSVQYKCDYCNAVEFNRIPEWLEIKSNTDFQLSISNNLQETNGITGIYKHSAIHFCSKACFIGYFFGSDDAEMFKSIDK